MARIRSIFNIISRLPRAPMRQKILWLQGLPDTAIRAARSVVDDAVAVGHALSLCLALVQAACPVTLLVGDIKEVKRSVRHSAQYPPRPMRSTSGTSRPLL